VETVQPIVLKNQQIALAGIADANADLLSQLLDRI
jgi:hypothetical protein